MRDAAFFLVVDDHYLGLGRALARRLTRMWRMDCHIFLENGGDRHQDRTGDQGVFIQENLLRGLRPGGLPSTHNWPGIVYDRIFAPAFLSGYRRLIYLDADIYPCMVAPKLLDLPLPGGLGAVHDVAAIGGVPNMVRLDPNAWRHSIGLKSQRYFNSGMLLIDPAIWLRTDYAEALRRYMAEYGAGVRMPDQDFLNAHFQDRWIQLSPRMNYQKALFNYGYERVFPPVFLHFSSSQKPWLGPASPDCPHGQFFGPYCEMFAQGRIDARAYQQTPREGAMRKLRTAWRHRLSQWGVGTRKERRQRREWDERSGAMFRHFAHDAAQGRYADLAFTLNEMPAPALSFDGRHLERRLDVTFTPLGQG